MRARAVLRYSWNLSQSRLGSLRVRALSGLLEGFRWSLSILLLIARAELVTGKHFDEVQGGAHSCRSIPLFCW